MSLGRCSSRATSRRLAACGLTGGMRALRYVQKTAATTTSTAAMARNGSCTACASFLRRRSSAAGARPAVFSATPLPMMKAAPIQGPMVVPSELKAWASVSRLDEVASGPRPAMSGLGPDAPSSSRLTLAQAFNSLGTTIGPWIGAAFIIGNGVALNTAGLAPAALDRLRRNEAHAVQLPFLAIAAVLVVVAAVFWTYRNARMPPVSPQAASLREVARLLHRPRLMLGTLAIFLYVGAEVSIGSVMTNYLMQPSVLGLPAARAGQHVSFYWGGAMIGRFIGAFVLRRARPGYALAACAVVAGLLATASSLSTGVVAAYALIAVGLFNSIMFPTIFALASEGLGEETPNGSAMLCMAIVGGAI